MTVELDHAVLDDLRALGGAELLDELVSLAEKDMTRCLAELHRAVDEADLAAVSRSAHAIVGVSASVGAPHTAETAATLEQAAESGQIGGASVLAAEIGRRWLRASLQLGQCGSRAASLHIS